MMPVPALPDGWTHIRLGDVCLPTPRRNPRLDGPGTFQYVDIEAVDNHQRRIVAPKLIKNSEAPSRARHEIRTGDVIFSLVRPYLKNIAVVPPDLDGQVASSAFCVLRPTDQLTTGYLFHIISTDAFIASVPTYGHSPPAGRDDELLNLRFPLPPVEEQRRIVAAVEQQITRLEAGTASMAAVRERLGDLRRSILLDATSRRLRRKDWQSLSLADVADPLRPICYGILKPRTAASGTVPYVEVRDLREPALRPEALKRTTKELHEAFPRSVLRTGDILVAVRGSYERIGIVPPDLEGANISRDVARVSPGEGVEPRYLLLWLRSPVAQRYFKRVARAEPVKPSETPSASDY